MLGDALKLYENPVVASKPSSGVKAKLSLQPAIVGESGARLLQYVSFYVSEASSIAAGCHDVSQVCSLHLDSSDFEAPHVEEAIFSFRIGGFFSVWFYHFFSVCC